MTNELKIFLARQDVTECEQAEREATARGTGLVSARLYLRRARAALTALVGDDQ